MTNASAGKRRWFLRWGIIALTGIALLAVALVVGWLFIVPRPTDVTVSGTATDLGEQHGRFLKNRIQLLTRSYLHRVICGGNSDVIQRRESKALSASQTWPLSYKEELSGLASASHSSLGTAAYANLFLDLGNAATGCRSAVVLTSNGVLHAHNLDWDDLGGLGRWTTTILRRNPTDGRFRTVSVGFPGMVGCLDVINEKGVALSFNQLGVGRGEGLEMPVWILVRRIAETCGTFEEARERILRAPQGMPFIITLSATRERKASVFERVREEVKERPLTAAWVAACNQAQTRSANPSRLDQLLAAGPVDSPADLGRILAHPDVMLGCNIYSVTFDAANNRLLLRSGKIPAAGLSPRVSPLF